MTRFLVTSLVLTILLNVGLRLFPELRRRIGERFQSMTEPSDPDRAGSRVRVFFPWKAMLVGSILLTVLVNVLAAFW